MKYPFIQEIIASSILVIFMIALLNPFDFLMLSHFHMTLLVLMLVAYGYFLIFLWKESPHDERENAHRALAGRSAFLVGSVLLLIGIVYESFNNMPVDHFLVTAFAGMIIAKIVTLGYTKFNQ